MGTAFDLPRGNFQAGVCLARKLEFMNASILEDGAIEALIAALIR
jgi:hypothetical protein